MDWKTIKASLVARGLWDEQGLSRRARARHCQRCRAPVMAGLDHDRSALSVYCDPEPLSALGELAALMADRPTYSLRYLGGAYSLDPRYAEVIAAHPAGSQFDVEVLVAHDCAAEQFAAEMRGGYVLKTRASLAAQAGGTNDEPPF